MGELSELFLNAMKHAFGEAVERSASTISERIANTLVTRVVAQWLEGIGNPQIIRAFLVAIILAVLIIVACVVVNLVIGRRRARVFVSFKHEREALTDTLTAELKRAGIAPVNLPFVDDPNHDELLDQVKRAIRDCDVLVCVPGRRPSFVESEVMMAFGLEKPIVFVLIEADTPRLPNTAKKGYPMFAFERLRRDKSRILATFCSYLAADWRSTVRLYGAIFAFSTWSLALAGCLAYSVSILVALGLLGPRVLPKVIDSHESLQMWATAAAYDPPTLSFIGVFLVMLLLPYSVFMMTRVRLRTRIRRAISAEKFSESLFSKSFLSQALDYSLAGEDLLNALYRGDVPAEHGSPREVTAR